MCHRRKAVSVDLATITSIRVIAQPAPKALAARARCYSNRSLAKNDC